jgi:phage tail-like protein
MPDFFLTGLKDPHVVHHFALEIQGDVKGTFQECSGIETTTEVIEHREQDIGGKQQITKIPGQLKVGDITLKRGVTDDNFLYEWRQKVLDGQIIAARTDGSIILQDSMDQQIARFNFRRAWPSKYKSGDFKATANDIMVEEVTLALEWIERAP